MAEKKQPKCFIIIPADPDPENAKKEQFKVYQKDGVTVQVAIGQKQEVPLWVAELAKRVGDIADYFTA